MSKLLTEFQSLTNYASFDPSKCGDDFLLDNLNEEDISSNSSDVSFNEHSVTFGKVKDLAGAWQYHRFDKCPWSDDHRPYIKEDECVDKNIHNKESDVQGLFEGQEECVVEDEEEEEEEEEIGILNDHIIGLNLSYLERSPVDLKHVLCKCVLSYKFLCDISAIKHYHYIQYLDLSWNELSSLAPLGQLPFLQYLDVSHNYLEKLLDFKATFYLSYVNVSYNFITDIPDLTAFWSITHLDLSNNQISKITGLRNLRYLSYLDLSHNTISILQNLNGLRIQFLILHNNIITGTVPDEETITEEEILADETISEETVEEQNNCIEDAAPTVEEECDTYEDYGDVPYEEYTEAEMEDEFNASAPAIEEDIPLALNTLTYIRSVDLSNNNLSSLQFTEGADNMESINMSSNNISSLLELYYLQNLRYLSRVNLSSNPITDLPYYRNVCLSLIPNLMLLDDVHINAESRIDVKHSFDVDPSLPGRESHMKLTLLERLNYPNIGAHVLPYDQPPPMVIVLVGPPASGKRNMVQKFCSTNKMLVAGVSHTTRPQIYGENDGEDYHFVSEDHFKYLTQKGKFIALSEFNGYSFGIAYEELGKCMDKIMVFHSDINTAFSLKVMGINPKLVLAMPRHEMNHLKYLGMKYCYDYVADGIIRVQNCPSCVQETESFRIISSNEHIIQDEVSVVKYVLDCILDLVSNAVHEEGASILRHTSSETVYSFIATANQDETYDYQKHRFNSRTSSILKPSVEKEFRRSYAVSFNDDTETEFSFLKERGFDFKKVSFSSSLSLDIVDDHSIIYNPKRKSVSETAFINYARRNKKKDGNTRHLSALSTYDVNKGNKTAYMTESQENLHSQYEKLTAFIRKVLGSRMEFLELHWSNPGLFRDIIFTDIEEASLVKLKYLLQYTVENYKVQESVNTIENSITFQRMMNSRLQDLNFPKLHGSERTTQRNSCSCNAKELKPVVDVIQSNSDTSNSSVTITNSF